MPNGEKSMIALARWEDKDGGSAFSLTGHTHIVLVLPPPILEKFTHKVYLLENWRDILFIYLPTYLPRYSMWSVFFVALWWRVSFISSSFPCMPCVCVSACSLGRQLAPAWRVLVLLPVQLPRQALPRLRLEAGTELQLCLIRKRDRDLREKG